jgi:probable HAF family extracellular repeat protein
MRNLTLMAITVATLVAACDEPAAPREVVSSELALTIRIVDLPPVSGGDASAAFGISPNGLVVGWSAALEHGTRNPVIWNHGAVRKIGTDAEAYGIRYDGTAVGWDLTRNRAMRWSEGQATMLPLLPGGDHSVARAINPDGLIVGQSSRSLSSGDKVGHAVLWKNGVARDLGTLGGRESQAFAVNQSGNIVGSSQDANGEQHAFLWKHGIMSELVTQPGCAFSQAFGINDSSYIVGGVCSGAALWKHGKLISLPKLPGDLVSTAAGINRSGDIVGWSGGGACETGTHAVLWRKGAIIDLGMPRGHFFSVATAISNAGEVVGYSGTRSSDNRECIAHAIKWVLK